MLGKAEYAKFVLKSICEERIRNFLSNKVIDKEIDLNNLKSKEVIDFLNTNFLYTEFISRIPIEFRPLYRFAAFVSDNIGKTKKDKFEINKQDGTAEKHKNEFIKKGKLNNFENVPGEWHLQTIFVNEVQKLKDIL